MTEIITALMLYISSITGWPIPPPPNIQFINSSQQFFMIANGCYEFPNIKVCETYDSRDDRIVALYNNITKTVMLNKDFWWFSTRDQSILLHELVHHMQYNSNYIKYKNMCRGTIEKEAYEIQRKWLAKYKRELFEVMNMNDLHYLIITTCVADYLH